jgi:DNA ligase-1
MELGVGGAVMSKALRKVCGLDAHSLRTLYHKHGDPGDVAYEAKKRQAYTLRKPKPLTIKGVYQALARVAASKGKNSQEAKQAIVERLLQDARGPEESRYIMRTVAQHVRQRSLFLLLFSFFSFPLPLFSFSICVSEKRIHTGLNCKER